MAEFALWFLFFLFLVVCCCWPLVFLWFQLKCLLPKKKKKRCLATCGPYVQYIYFFPWRLNHFPFHLWTSDLEELKSNGQFPSNNVISQNRIIRIYIFLLNKSLFSYRLNWRHHLPQFSKPLNFPYTKLPLPRVYLSCSPMAAYGGAAPYRSR